MDIYDENKIKTGKVINREDRKHLKNNEYTLSVHCWIINSKKEILITQRSMNMNRGGKWEDTHGGVKTGENSIEGIKRELKEEKDFRPARFSCDTGIIGKLYSNH